ncbi:MAG: ribonuclease D [Nitrospiria bacterium]
MAAAGCSVIRNSKRRSKRCCDRRRIIPDYEYITQPGSRDQAVTELMQCAVIGVDTEGDSLYSYEEQVSLIQISGGGRHYIFDPLLLDTVKPLGPLFENRSILKIFHGSDYDVVSMKRDFQFQTGPIFDTALAARAIGIQRFSLQSLIEKYFQITLSKKYQKANWRLRPLSAEQLDYASGDTRYLIQLHALLKAEVEKKGRLDQVEEECRLMEEITWNGRPFEPNDYLRIKGARLLPEPSQKVLRELIVARDQLAKEKNRPPFKVISGRHFIEMAKALPQDLSALTALFPNKNSAVLKHAPIWLDAVAKGLKTDRPLPERVKNNRASMTPEQKILFQQLKEWRNGQAEAEEVEPAMVFTAAVLEEIARVRPVTIDGFGAIALVRPWQTKRYGETLLKIIAEAKAS